MKWIHLKGRAWALNGRPLFLALLTFFLSASAFAQTFSLEGIVRDGSGGAIEGATVRVAGVEQVPTMTDGSGRFVFAGLTAGKYKMDVQADGKKTVNKKIRLSSDTLLIIPMTTEVFLDREVVVTSNKSSVSMQQRGLFDGVDYEDDPDRIGNFYSTHIFDDDVTHEIWFTKEGGCVNVERSTEHVYSGDGSLHITWDKSSGTCPWTGMGFGWDNWAGKDFGQIYDRCALQFQVRTDGRPMPALPVAMAMEDYGDGQAWVGFSRKMVNKMIDTAWTTVTIPFMEFNWLEFEADVTNIKQFMIQFEAMGDIYIDDMRVIEHKGTLKSRAEIAKTSSVSADEWHKEYEEPTIQVENADVYVEFGAEHMHLVAEVKDDSPLQNANKDADLWNGDAIELAWSSDYQANPKRAFLMTTDRHIGIRASEQPMIWDWKRRKALESAEIVCEKTSDGYILKANIPWSALDLEEVEAGSIYGMEFALDQGDLEGRKQQIRWNSPDVEGFHKNPSIWGDFRLVQKTIEQ